MAKDNVIDLKKPEPFIDDPITDILRSGARQLLAQALEIEISSFLSQYAVSATIRAGKELHVMGIFLSVKSRPESARFQLRCLVSGIVSRRMSQAESDSAPPYYRHIFEKPKAWKRLFPGYT